MKIIAIAAMDQKRVIGHQGDIPWNVPGEQKRFADLTRGHTVLMGRKTFDSLPERYKPLPKRKNIVVSRSLSVLPEFPDVLCYSDIADCVAACRSGELELPSDTLWVVGGEQVYRETLPHWDEVYLTLVAGEHPGDTFFPEFEELFEEVSRQDEATHSYLVYRRI